MVNSGQESYQGVVGPIHVLVVDDQAVIRDFCAEIAGGLGFRVTGSVDGATALEIVEHDHVDIVLTDLKMPGMSGLDLLERVREVSPMTEVVLMTAFGTVPSAVLAMKLGAYDYLTKPFGTQELTLILERLVSKLDLENENRVLREQLRQGGGYRRLLGNSPPMMKLFKLIAKVSQNQYPVLIQGESGTGKELVARSIHESGPLANKPFLPIDCGSLVSSLIESELFGYVRGAFTGAVRTKEGLLEAAQGGTVFLDEIGEMPVDLQSKFLRALQEKEVRPVGGSRRIRIEARIIAATNRDLEVAVQQGAFRKDLFFRLNVVTLRLPPLRERNSDIPLLIDHFITKFASPSKPRPSLSSEALHRLTSYDWPGNVRELEHCIERAVALSSGPILQTSDLTTNLQGARQGSMAASAAGNGASRPAGSGTVANDSRVSQPSPPPGFVPVIAAPLPSQNRIIPLAELEKQAIYDAIRNSGGDKLAAARMLGIGKTTLYRKLKEYAASAS